LKGNEWKSWRVIELFGARTLEFYVCFEQKLRYKFISVLKNCTIYVKICE